MRSNDSPLSSPRTRGPSIPVHLLRTLNPFTRSAFTGSPRSRGRQRLGCAKDTEHAQSPLPRGRTEEISTGSGRYRFALVLPCRRGVPQTQDAAGVRVEQLVLVGLRQLEL